MRFSTDENTHKRNGGTVPEHFKGLLIPNAAISYTEDFYGSILSQELKESEYTIEQHHFFIKERCKLNAFTTKPILAINYMLQGSPVAMLQPAGNIIIKEGSYQMFYVPSIVQEVIFNPGRYHSIHINYDPLHLKKIANKRPELLQLVNNATQLGDQLLPQIGGKINAKIKATLMDIIEYCSDLEEHDLQLKAKVIELLVNYVRKHYSVNKATGIDKENLISLERFISDNLTQPLHIEELSRMCGKSKSEFHRLFKLHFNESPHHLIQRLRANNAMKLIISTDLPIGSIATTVGFEDLSHFSSAFKRIYGNSPRFFRDNRTKSQEDFTSKKI